jgi:hypothetical protein
MLQSSALFTVDSLPLKITDDIVHAQQKNAAITFFWIFLTLCVPCLVLW